MGWIRWTIVGAIAAITLNCVYFAKEPELPDLDPNPWWGPGNRQSEDKQIRPFKINIPQKDIDDLKTRLDLPPRYTTPLEQSNFTYGFNKGTLEIIVGHWKTKYDWKKREKFLNSYPHYKTKIEGLDIHFLRAKPEIGSSKVEVRPLLLVHGWPGSFVEFYGILPLLSKPQQGSNVVFDVICPSIPGYGFSDASSKPGLSHIETAQIFLKLMKRLRFEKFYVQGGDWGSAIVTNMATLYPDIITGVHINMIVANTMTVTWKTFLGSLLPSGILVSAEDQHKLYPLGESMKMLLRESGYMHLQATKPDTLGTALNSSPVGLAAYILEKFSTWTDINNINKPDGGILQKDFPFDLDSLLDNVCIYWFTGSITTSMRYYAEAFNTKAYARRMDNIPCRVPAGLAAFPNEIVVHPENFAAHKFYDIVSYTEMPKGGHFAAMERPDLLAADIHNFVIAVEERSHKKKH